MSSSLPNAKSGVQNDDTSLQVGGDGLDAAAEIKDSHLGGMKIVLNPPDLDAWRERLFNVDEPITLTEEQFQTYFPHVDNIYSHRSTQKYKRKPFVSHYWDCRLKGRPSGTPKSDDPNKKKRKRVARERDLCDVKIKITEYFPEATMADISNHQKSGIDSSVLTSNGNNHASPTTLFFPDGGSDARGSSQPFGMLTPDPALAENSSLAAGGQKLYTIQRVNGNGGNGKTDGIGGGHRHTLEDSDRVKKNSVHRYLLKKSKDEKKAMNHLLFGLSTMADQHKQAQPKTYHKKATGEAHTTVLKRSQENDLKLFGSCFCPFVQRVWIALEVKNIPYQYIEVDPYEKPPELLAINPRGLVPALLHGNWGCYESSVLLEYLEDLDEGTPLLPPGDAKLRAHCRLWADHINRHIVPSFYKVLMEQNPQNQSQNAAQLQEDIEKLVNASHVHGPFFLGPSMSYVDIQLAPWVLRLSRVLKPYRGWTEPAMGSRLGRWIQAIEENEHVMATTSSDELYLESYERLTELKCAENRPNTSQLANAINSGRSLP
ncbi:glutathione transferase, putative [Talaromyces stipitatus ATCC 10500]|uniref:Glutathione transferase, putative n=1 Tax=Talaromyces stipitatus (strain ATCC 10500 / CBS 375.48 / QM 6759 / NRRL 1006) TaxID=441959 RepID=B8LWC4_TALSN|nr:glutathione transferase, putative [Talaromyces stipitatus ATCC 10500]EED24235.1 glutathione transferase, putative [Talaromyces stipitatus ATCC 10500]